MSGPRSEATRQILAFIEANAPVLQSTLNDKFRPQAAAAGVSVTRWLTSRLDNMAHARYIEHTASGWVLCTQQRQAKARLPCDAAPRPRKSAEPPLDTSVAQPRRFDMFGPSYVPPVQVRRPGSEDYAAKPSLINGQPRSYRSAW